MWPDGITNVMLLSDPDGQGFWIQYSQDGKKFKSEAPLYFEPSNDMLLHLIVFHDEFFAEVNPNPVNPVNPPDN